MSARNESVRQNEVNPSDVMDASNLLNLEALFLLILPGGILRFNLSSTLHIFSSSVRPTSGQQVTMVNGLEPDESKPKIPEYWHSQPMPVKIIHVGAGATGLCTAYKMQRQLSNYELVCYEKNSEIGGTWFESESIQG